MASLATLYNNLGDVYEAAKLIEANPKALDVLARLLVAQNLNGIYDIRLNHKHFDIAEDKQVVGFSGSDIIITPSDYFINDNGEAIPYEFTYTAGSFNAAGLLNKAFLAEWSLVLREHSLAGLLGLSVREQGVPAEAHEVSDPAARVNKLYYGEAPANGMSVVSTTWQVEETGGIIKAKQCKYCSQIQRHGQKC